MPPSNGTEIPLGLEAADLTTILVDHTETAAQKDAMARLLRRTTTMTLPGALRRMLGSVLRDEEELDGTPELAQLLDAAQRETPEAALATHLMASDEYRAAILVDGDAQLLAAKKVFGALRASLGETIRQARSGRRPSHSSASASEASF